MKCDVCLKEIKRPIKPFVIQKDFKPQPIYNIVYKGKKINLCNNCYRIIAFIAVRDNGYTIDWSKSK